MAHSVPQSRTMNKLQKIVSDDRSSNNFFVPKKYTKNISRKKIVKKKKNKLKITIEGDYHSNFENRTGNNSCYNSRGASLHYASQKSGIFASTKARTPAMFYTSQTSPIRIEDQLRIELRLESTEQELESEHEKLRKIRMQKILQIHSFLKKENSDTDNQLLTELIQAPTI